MYCKKCGAKLSDDAQFCSSCGTPVDKSNSPVERGNGALTKNWAYNVLLFAPLISTVLIYVIAATFFVRSSNLWWISYIINVIACSADCGFLSRKGYDVSSIRKYLIFVPLYIYKRAALLNGKKLVETAIWVAVFFITLIIPIGFWAKFLGTNPSVIDMVRNMSFDKYPDVTVGELMEGTIDDCKWDTYMGTHSRVLVQALGKIDEKRMDIVFEVGMTNRFHVSSVTGFNVHSEDDKEKFVDYLYERYKSNSTKADNVKEIEEESRIEEKDTVEDNKDIAKSQEETDSEAQVSETQEEPQKDEEVTTQISDDGAVWYPEWLEDGATEAALPDELYEIIKGEYYSEVYDKTFLIDSPSTILYESDKYAELNIEGCEAVDGVLYLYVTEPSGSYTPQNLFSLFRDKNGKLILSEGSGTWDLDTNYWMTSAQKID